MATDKEQRTIEIILKAQDANASIKEMGAGAAVMTAQLTKMGKDDPGRAKLLADVQELNQRLATSRAELRGVTKSQEELAAESLRVVVNGQKVSASFDEMKAAASQLERELGQLSGDAPARAKMLADYKALAGRIDDVKAEMGHATQEGGKFKQMLGLVGVAFTAEAAIEGVMGIGRAIFDTTAKFETYGVVLKQALGSESAAQLALHDIQTMAAKTPFSVDELTSSFIKFVNRGLQPSMAEMTKLADLAASQGKSFDQLTEAVLDAGTGEFERLKEFGIQASKNGAQVELSFKGVQKTVANTPEAINAALMSFGELKGVMGDTDAISKTLEGTMSNVGDTADQVAIQYGSVLRPVFMAVLSTVGFLLGMLGSLPGFLYDNRGALLALAGAVLTFNAPMIQANALLLYNAVLAKADVVWKGAQAVATRAATIAQEGLNLALTANPIGAVIAVGTLLVGLFVLLYDKSARLRAAVAGLSAGFMAFVTTIKDGVVQQLTGIADLMVGIFTGSPEKIKAGLVGIGGSLKTVFYDAGKNAGAAFSKGYEEKVVADQQNNNKLFDQAWATMQKKLEAQAKARIAAEAAARLEGLKGEEADLKVRLAQVEEGTRQEMRLKQQLLAVQAKIELSDTKKTEVEKRVIRAESQAKIQELEREFNAKQAKLREEERKRLAKLAEEAAKKELELQHALQDMRLAAIKDVHMRELAEIDLQTARKIEALKGTDEQITEQTLLLEEDRKVKVAELQAKWDEEAQKKKQEEHEKQLELNAAGDEEYAAYLENKVANGLMAEQAYQDALYEIKKTALENQLQLLVAGGKGETAEAARIRTALLQGETAHTLGVKKQEEDLKRFKRAMASEGRALLTDSLAFLVDNLDKQSQAYGIFKAAMKAMQLFEIGISLQAELAANHKWAADNPANAATAGFAGITQGAMLDVLSIGRATIAAAKVAAFADGGRTDAGKAMPLEMLASLLSGRSGGSFAPGGPVTGPTLGLIGEAGAELVIPNWLYADPKQANLMGFLEAQIASRGGAFVKGGATGASPVTMEAPVGDAPVAMLDVLERIAQGQVEFREEISDWQRNLGVNLNYHKLREGLDVGDKTRNGGGLK
jgi:hypothetical protein